MRISTRPRSLYAFSSTRSQVPLLRRFSGVINFTQLSLTKRQDAIAKVKTLEPFVYEKLDDVLIDLWSEKPRKQIKIMPFKDVRRHYIKPGIALVPHSKIQLPINEHRKPPGYTLKNLDINVLISAEKALALETMKPLKKVKPSRRFLFGLWGSQNLDYYMRTMNMAWHSLMEGTHVEIQVHLKHPSKDQAAFGEHVLKYLHLRPDVILRSMPQNSSIMIQPHTDNKICCWTMAGPFRNRNGSIETVKDMTFKLDKKRPKNIPEGGPKIRKISQDGAVLETLAINQGESEAKGRDDENVLGSGTREPILEAEMPSKG